MLASELEKGLADALDAARPAAGLVGRLLGLLPAGLFAGLVEIDDTRLLRPPPAGHQTPPDPGGDVPPTAAADCASPGGRSGNKRSSGLEGEEETPARS